MTYGEMLQSVTCILCGAPIDEGSRCPYCGSLYLNKPIEEVVYNYDPEKSYELNPLECYIEVFNDFAEIPFHGRFLKYPLANERNVKLVLGQEEGEIMLELFNRNYKSSFMNNIVRDFIINFKDHRVVLSGAFIQQIKFDYNNIHTVKINPREVNILEI